MDQVRDAAAITCREYPVKKRFMQSMAPRIVQRKSGREVIAYELQSFLNELERSLRRLDPQAEISLTDQEQIGRSSPSMPGTVPSSGLMSGPIGVKPILVSR